MHRVKVTVCFECALYERCLCVCVCELKDNVWLSVHVAVCLSPSSASVARAERDLCDVRVCACAESAGSAIKKPLARDHPAV